MSWNIEFTETFEKALKVHKKNSELLAALDKKLQRLKDDPYAVGAMLHGELHGWHSARLVRKFRLLFKTDDSSKTIYLGAIDHREHAY